MKSMSRPYRVLTASLLTVSACLSLAACSRKDARADAEHGAEARGAHGPAATVQHWTYDGPEGPAHWAQMGGANTICGNGQRQSPVDISGVTRNMASKMTMEYHASQATIQNNGHTVIVTPADGGGITLDGTLYTLKSVQFHSPSEHAINGRSTALETQFIHEDARKHVLIISVLSDIGTADPMLGSLWTYLPSDPGQPVPLADLLVNAQDLMPGTEDFYVYTGSLTTPPCTEEVTWMVYSSPLSVSAEQADAFQRLIGPNARPLQPANGRNFFHASGF